MKGNKIVYVGDAKGAKALIGDETQVFDTTGMTVMPGFVSGHDHLVGAGWLLAGVKLTDARNQDEPLRLVKKKKGTLPMSVRPMPIYKDVE